MLEVCAHFAQCPRIDRATLPMSTKRKPGRPSLGIYKEKPSVLIAKDVMKVVRKEAFTRRMTLSAFMEEALRGHLEATSNTSVP